MLKKGLAILLSMAMLFSATGVFAAVVTNETTGMVTYTDDFESYNITQDTVISKYPDGSTYVSDVFGVGTGVGAGAAIVYNKGKDDSKALKIISSGNDWRTTVTKTITASTSTEVLELSYDLKVTPKNATGDGNVVLGSNGQYGSNPLFEVVYDASGNGYFKDCVNAQNTYEYSSDAWYKVIIRQTNGNGRYGYILDENGTVVLQTARSSQRWATIAAVFTKGSDGTELTIDNAVLKHYDEANVAPNADVVSSTPANRATDISVDTKEMTVTFNKEMATAPTNVSLTGGSVAITAAVTTTDNETFTLTWTNALEGNTTYTVSLADFKDEKNALPTTSTLSFTTENTDIIKMTDNFESAEVISANGGYNTSKDAEISPLSMDETSVVTASLADGYTQGTRALKLETNSTIVSSDATWNCFRTAQKHSISNGEKLVATWRFYLDNAGTGLSLCIGATDSDWAPSQSKIITRVTTTSQGSTIVFYNGDALATAKEITEGRWYNIVYALSANEESICFTDAVTGDIVYQKSKVSTSLADNTAVYIHVLSEAASSSANLGVSARVDDFTLWKIKPDRTEHKLATTIAPVKEITGNNVSFTLNFNQPVIADTDMVALYLEDADGVAGALKNTLAYSIPTIKNSDFCQQEISFSDLQNYTDYTFDYSGITSVAGSDLGDSKVSSLIGFTTAPVSDEVSVVGSISCSGLTAGSKITANLYSQEDRTATIIAAFYNRTFPTTLSDVQIEKNVSLNEGINNKVITLNKNIDAEYIRLYVWDGLSSMVPLMEKYEALAPVESLDVLMIGNSLSEDAQRYLNKMADADGLDLNLTVKGVGGSIPTHHMNNLKAELAAGLDTGYNTDAAAVYEYIVAAGDNSGRVLYFTYENGVEKKGNTDKLLIPALMEKQYDVISLQLSEYSDAGYEEALPYLTAKIRELQPNAEIIFYQTWSNYSEYRNVRYSRFTDTIKPSSDEWAAQVGANVNKITNDGKAIKIVPAGHAFYLADNFYDWCSEKYKLTAGNTDASAQTKALDWLNTSRGLWRDVNHASYYGCYLADAVWYEAITGRKAPVSLGIVPKPTGVGPTVEINGNDVTITDETTNYFDEPTDAEHLAKLQQLSDVAHSVMLLNNK